MLFRSLAGKEQTRYQSYLRRQREELGEQRFNKAQGALEKGRQRGQDKSAAHESDRARAERERAEARSDRERRKAHEENAPRPSTIPPRNLPGRNPRTPRNR